MYQTSIIGLVLLITSLLIFLRIRRTNLNLPPSPPKLPIIGNLHQLGSLPYRSLHDLSNRYGPLMLIQLGQVSTLIVSSREMAKEIMKTHDITFANRPPSKVANLILNGNDDIAFTSYGEYWRQARKLCVTHLLSTKMVQSFRRVKEKEVELMMERISQLSSSLGIVNMSEMLNKFASNVITIAVSDKFAREEGKKDIMRLLADESSKILGNFHPADFFPIIGWINFLPLDTWGKRIGKRWDGILEEIINEHAKRSLENDIGHKNTNFVDALLSLENDSNNDFSFTRKDIKAILIDMFAAGVDTSYTVLEWSMAELVRNPEVMKKLQDEVRAIGRGKSLIKDEDLSEMSYLRAVIKETMRIHMPVPLLVQRESSEICQLGGYDIPRKTRVIINAWAIARDPKVWEEPEDFKPDRFLGSHAEFKGNDFEFIPFGSGRRICPGINFAIQTIELALANLVNRFEWALPGNMISGDIDMDDAFGLVVHKKQILELTAKLSTSK